MRLAVEGYADDIAEEGMSPLKELMTNFQVERLIKGELDWVRSNPKARQAKSKARLTAYEDLVAQSNKVQRDSAEISIPPGRRLGDTVIEAKGLAKGFGDRLLIENLNFSLPRSGIVGVIGEVRDARERVLAGAHREVASPTCQGNGRKTTRHDPASPSRRSALAPWPG